MAHRFIFLADTQLGCFATFSGFDGDAIEAYAERGMNVRPSPPVEGFEWDAARYREAVAAVNRLQPAFVVIGGDLVDDPNADDQVEAFFEITAGIDDEIPIRWVPGNHDIAFDAKVPTPASLASYRERFGDDLVSFTFDGTLYLGLNTTVIDQPQEVPGEWERQLAWLDDELATAARLGVDRVVAIGHHPLFLDDPDEADTYWNLPRDRRTILLDRFAAAGVRLGFSGHWHRNHLAVGSHFTQVVSGPVGYPLGNDPSGYRVVEMGVDGIDHDYRPLEPLDGT
jgi:3',5'-cyclic AMP phosphodiesterase CpdA